MTAPSDTATAWLVAADKVRGVLALALLCDKGLVELNQDPGDADATRDLELWIGDLRKLAAEAGDAVDSFLLLNGRQVPDVR